MMSDTVIIMEKMEKFSDEIKKETQKLEQAMKEYRERHNISEKLSKIVSETKEKLRGK